MPHRTIIDLPSLSLSFGDGTRLEFPLELEPLELGGQTYTASEPVTARLDVSRPTNAYAFRLRFPLKVEGPCMRCLEPARVETEVGGGVGLAAELVMSGAEAETGVNQP